MRTCNEKGCNKTVHRDTYKCKKHLKIYRSNHYHKTKQKLVKNDNRKYDPEIIKKELSGKARIKGGLFESCTPAQIRVLQSDGMINLLPEVRERFLE